MLLSNCKSKGSILQNFFSFSSQGVVVLPEWAIYDIEKRGYRIWHLDINYYFNKNKQSEESLMSYNILKHDI